MSLQEREKKTIDGMMSSLSVHPSVHHLLRLTDDVESRGFSEAPTLLYHDVLRPYLYSAIV